VVHDEQVDELIEKLRGDPESPISNRAPDEIRAALEGLTPVEQLLDLRLRTGWRGDAFGDEPGGISLAKLAEHPHGVDLGPMVERYPARLATESGRLELAPAPLVEDWKRVMAALEGADAEDDRMLLIGRRHVRSNNSWMHNVETLVRGRPRCTLLVHPDDASRLGLEEGGEAELRSRVGAIRVPIEISDSVMRGVVSLPHGWGHDVDGIRMDVAAAHAGVNSNVLSDDARVDALSGNAILNGIPVEISALGSH
jgi:anaerobic selenocysteine-containing dehydrogenase